MRTRTLSRTNGGSCLQARGKRHAFSLVEVVVAIGIVTFCLLTLFALIAVGLNNNRLVRQQIIALNLCRQIESDLKATASTNTVSPLYGIPIPAAGAANSTNLYDSYAASTATFAPTNSTGSQYRFTITLTGPPTSRPNDPVNAQIQATWPPQIAPIAPSTPVGSNPTNVIGTVNLNVAINRFGS